VIGTLLWTSWLGLRRDTVALAVVFVLPIVFYSVFGAIFAQVGGGGGDDDAPAAALRIGMLDLDGTDASAGLLRTLAGHEAIEATGEPPADRAAALVAVRGGDLGGAVIVEPGFEARFGRFGPDRPRVEIVHDVTNPMGRPTLAGLIQASSFTSAPERLMLSGLGELEAAGGILTEAQRGLVEEIAAAMRGEGPYPGEPADAGPDAGRDTAGAGGF